MAQSEQGIGDLAAALAKAQGKIQEAPTSGEGKIGREGSQYGQRSYRYATLTDVWTACREALAENGLAVTQTFDPGPEGFLMLTTTLLHASGQWVQGTILMPAGAGPQDYGKAATYARRYGLAAMVGVTADDDDDAAGVKTKAQQQPRQRVDDRPAPTQSEQPRHPIAANAQSGEPEPETSGDRAAAGTPNADTLAHLRETALGWVDRALRDGLMTEEKHSVAVAWINRPDFAPADCAKTRSECMALGTPPK